MKENGNRAMLMDKANFCSKMEIIIKDNGLMVNRTDMVSILPRVMRGLKEIGRMIFNKVRVDARKTLC